MLLIGIIGPKASGKETVAKYIAEKYGGRHHSHSEILTDILDLLGLEHSRANEMKLVALRKKFGPNVLTNALNKKMRAENSPLEAVTGIRFQSELDNIRAYPQNATIYINAPIELRYKRQLSRTEKSDDETMTFEHFAELEQRETEKDIAALGKSADFSVENTGDQVALDAKIDDIMKQVLARAH